MSYFNAFSWSKNIVCLTVLLVLLASVSACSTYRTEPYDKTTYKNIRCLDPQVEQSSDGGASIKFRLSADRYSEAVVDSCTRYYSIAAVSFDRHTTKYANGKEPSDVETGMATLGVLFGGVADLFGLLPCATWLDKKHCTLCVSSRQSDAVLVGREILSDAVSGEITLVSVDDGSQKKKKISYSSEVGVSVEEASLLSIDASGVRNVKYGQSSQCKIDFESLIDLGGD